MKESIAWSVKSYEKLAIPTGVSRVDRERILRERLQTYIKCMTRLTDKIDYLRKDGRKNWREIKETKLKLEETERMYALTIYEIRTN